MKKISIAVGVIIKDGKYLCMKRSDHEHDDFAYKYEFPGGKIEKGETAIECLYRELYEELDIQIKIEKVHFLMETRHQYSDLDVHMSIFTYPYQEEQIKLNVHEEMQWVEKNRLNELDWIEGDIEIINCIQKR